MGPGNGRRWWTDGTLMLQLEAGWTLKEEHYTKHSVPPQILVADLSSSYIPCMRSCRPDHPARKHVTFVADVLVGVRIPGLITQGAWDA